MQTHQANAKLHSDSKSITIMHFKISCHLTAFAISFMFVFLTMCVAGIPAYGIEPPTSGIVADPAFAGKDVLKVVPDEVWAQWGITRKEIPDAENAAVNYNKAAELFISLEDYAKQHEDAQDAGKLKAIESYVWQYGWFDEAKELIPYIEANLSAWQEFFKGTAKDKCQFPAKYNPAETLTAINTKLKYLSDMIEFANFATLYSSYLMSEGKPGEAVQTEFATLRAGKHVLGGSHFVDYLVGVLVQNIAEAKLQDFTLRGNLHRETLERVRDEVKTISKMMPMLEKVVKDEHVRSLAILEDSYRGYINLRVVWKENAQLVRNFPNGLLLRFKLLIERILYPLEWARSDLNWFYSFYDEIVKLPLPEMLTKNSEIKARKKYLQNKRSPVYFLIGGTEGFSNVAARSRIILNVLITMVGIELYKMDAGIYPDALEELVPKYLDAIPIDFATGEPLHYRREESRYVIWSVGADQKDDGGSTDERLMLFDSNRSKDYVFTSDVKRGEPFQWPPVDGEGQNDK